MDRQATATLLYVMRQKLLRMEREDYPEAKIRDLEDSIRRIEVRRPDTHPQEGTRDGR